MTLFARTMGNGREALVFLHGFGGTHASWGDIPDRISRNMPVLLYDLPGHGESYACPDAGSAKMAAKGILKDLTERDIAHAHIVGHSMGGAIAALMAIMDPRRVASLTLLSPGGFGPEINHRLLTRYAAARDDVELLPCLEAMYGWMSPIPAEVVAQSLSVRALPGRVDALIGIAATLARDGRQGQLPRKALDALTMPVSVVWGKLDNVLPVRQTHGLPWRFGVHLFTDLGHMLAQEAPHETEAIIRRTTGIR